MDYKDEKTLVSMQSINPKAIFIARNLKKFKYKL